MLGRHPAKGRLAAWLLLGAVGCAAGRADPPVRDPVDLRYDIHHRLENGRSLEVTLWLPPDHPRHFLFAAPGAIGEVELTRSSGEQRTLEIPADGALLLEADDSQVRYRFRFPSQGSVRSGAVGQEGAMVPGRVYLLRPRQARDERFAQLRFTGAEVMLPWNNPGPEGWYRIRESDLIDAGFHTFGGRRCSRRLEGARLELRVIDLPTTLGDVAVCDWVAQAAAEVLTVRQRFPYERVAVTVVTVASSEASPFGMLMWSEPPSVVLLAGRSAGTGQLRRDWVAVHELLHLIHPTFLRRGTWLSEGLATYYTEVARMRSGRFTQAAGWAELVTGFQRGAAQGGPRTVTELASQGGGYLGYYWGGAAILLELDVAIRRASGEARSLDSALELLGQGGFTATLEEFGAAVDEAAGQPLWEQLTRQRLSQPPGAGTEALLRQLGVLPAGASVTFDDQAPLAAIRRALSRRASPPSQPGNQ
ncbi:MAG: hypothetical protein M3Y59_14115 [Myxococcota bacterium]|nr:hypothetical protein [Myxococcota bacterium]